MLKKPIPGGNLLFFVCKETCTAIEKEKGPFSLSNTLVRIVDAGAEKGNQTETDRRIGKKDTFV